MTLAFLQYPWVGVGGQKTCFCFIKSSNTFVESDNGSAVWFVYDFESMANPQDRFSAFRSQQCREVSRTTPRVSTQVVPCRFFHRTDKWGMSAKQQKSK